MKHKRLQILMIIAALTAYMGTAVICCAEPSGYGVVGENQTIELFDGIAELRVAEGWEFFDAAAYYRLNDIDDEIEYNTFAVIFPVSDDGWWSITIEHSDMGFIEEVGDPDAEKMLNYYESNDEEAVFYYKPVYDHNTHKLSWCVEITYDDGDSYLEYRELFFIRDGYMSIHAYFDPQDEATAGLIDLIKGAVTVSGGHTYDDFDPGNDYVCEYDFIGGFLYGEYDSYDSGTQDSSSDFSPIIKIAGSIVSYLVVTLLLCAAGIRAKKKLMRPGQKKPKAPKEQNEQKKTQGKSQRTDIKREKRHRSVNEKPQFKFRRSYDIEERTDSKSYYLMLREEEDRMAQKNVDNWG